MMYDLDSVIQFGTKHRGKTVETVLEEDPRWLLWAVETLEDFQVDKALQDEIVRAAEGRSRR